MVGPEPADTQMCTRTLSFGQPSLPQRATHLHMRAFCEMPNMWIVTVLHTRIIC